MESDLSELLHRASVSRRRWTGAIRHAVPRVVVFVALAAFGLRAQPAAGSIVTHSITSTGNRVLIDDRQNVYSYSSGGGCGESFGVPIGCQPMSIIKADGTGAVVFQITLTAPGSASPGGFTVDPAGEIYFTGVSQGQLPTTPNAALPAPSIGGGPFAAKLSADGSTYLYLTYLPSALAAPSAIQLDAQGNAYIAGINANSQPFVTALNPDGSAFLYTTVLAAAETIGLEPSLAVDAAGNAVIAGETGFNFPVTAGVLQPLPSGSQNAFLTKLDSTGNIVFSTYLGETGGAYVGPMQIDSTGSIYVGGSTGPGFPATPGTYQPVAAIPLWRAGDIGFVAKIKPDGSAIDWATYVPSNGIGDLAFGSSGDVYLASGAGVGFPITASARSRALAETITWWWSISTVTAACSTLLISATIKRTGRLA